MISILVHLLINAAALWVATRLVDGITFTGTVPTLLGVALVFGVLNVIVRLILKFLTFPFFIITLGLFTFVLNAVMPRHSGITRLVILEEESWCSSPWNLASRSLLLDESGSPGTWCKERARGRYAP